MNNYQKSETTFLLGKIAMVGKQGCGCTISGECIGTRRVFFISDGPVEKVASDTNGG